ncbi:PAS domain-containing protein [Halosimplex litoreum]|uniref:histidine kinase n=1 Tax=Halosimplex litoreum TaxID=1198301 RepID=A0A7T3KW48_9EURY|nr:ATP-binding protein [Halosimplex litoreum]QPV63525.1 PAS domain-containing protein [Halosimplex litoreum]
MSHLLADPTVALVVGGSAGDRDRVRTAISDGDGELVAVAAADRSDLTERLSTRDDVGCVVAVGVDEAAFDDAYEAARAVSDHLPVVAYTGEAAVAAAVAARADCRYLPRSVAVETLASVVGDAVATYRERRQAAADSSVLGTLLEETDLTVFAKDEAGRYVRLAGVPYSIGPGRTHGKTDPEVFRHDTDAATEAYEDDLAVVETGEPLRNKVERFGGPGADHWSEVTKLPWRDGDGEIQGVVGFAREVTGRVKTEQKLEEQKDRFDQFASYVSHDLRTPLQISVGALERAREGHDEAFDRIERANDRIEEILEDLSALSKGDRSDVDLSDEVLDVLNVGVPTTEFTPLVERVWSVHGTDDATLVVDVPTGTEIITDAETVRPLVENLLKNALDHAGPDVTVRVGTMDRGFFIEDDGPGIPETQREKILEAGYTTAEDGTGTGLAIATETIEQQEWDIAVGESASGGARFEFTDCPVVVPTETTPTRSLELTDSADVGDVSVAGSSRRNAADGGWTVVGDGEDIWQDIDEFHICYGEATDPVRVEGRLADFEGVHDYSKAGLMIRDSLDEDAAFGFVGATNSHGTETLWREEDGAYAASDQLEEPYEAYPWYRIETVDGTVTMSWSTDGEEWQALDQRPVATHGTVVVGLAVCSHSVDETSEAVFEDVTVTELDVDD